jgi:hypothetical protein
MYCTFRVIHGPANSRARDILDKFILYVGYRTVLNSCYCHNHTPQVEKRFGTMLYQPLGTAPLNVFPAEGRICSVIRGEITKGQSYKWLFVDK